MLKRKTTIILFTVMLLSQALVLQPVISKAPLNRSVLPATQSAEQSIISWLTPDSPGGTEQVKTNVFIDGGFEKVDVDGSPSAIWDSGTGYSEVNHSYQDEVHTGSYGAYISSRGTNQYSASESSSRYMGFIPESSYLDEKITFDFWYNAKANPDFTSGAEIRVRARFSTNIGNHYINYYLSRVSGIPANSTTTAYIDIRGGLNSWTNIVRNLTYDFEDSFSTGADLSLSYVTYIYFYTTSVMNPTGDTILLFDDVSLTNDTGFNFLYLNGDFEDGNSNYWSDYNNGPGSVYRTAADFTEGSYAMNLTATCPDTSSSGNAYAEEELYEGWGAIPKSHYVEKQGDLTFSFDWKYSDTPGLGTQRASYFLFSQNNSYSSYIYLYYGDENDVVPNSNFSSSGYSYYYLAGENLGSRNTWNTASIDFYTLITSLNFTNLAPHYHGFILDCNNVENGKAQFLVDNLQVTTYPASDPSFEGAYYFDSSDPILYWQTPGFDDYVNITSDSYTGNWAANLSSYGGYTNVYCRRPTFFPVLTNQYTDFYWRLDSMTDIANLAYAEIRLEIDNNQRIHYILGNNSYYGSSNGSLDYYYYVEGHNQIGVWNNIFRDLNVDVTTAFGSGNWNITRIDLMCIGQGTEVVKLIVDDMHFVRDIEAPIISNLEQTPINPEHGQYVYVSVDAIDNIEIASIHCAWRLGGTGSYFTAPMNFEAGKYRATIPPANYGTIVEYFFLATDIYDQNSELGSFVSPFSYIAGDFTNPVLVVEAPLEIQVLNETIIFNITEAYDTGSGIDFFEIELNGSIAYQGSIIPANFTWDTTIYTNMEYDISFRLFDVAGNSIDISYHYEVYNPPTGWETFKAFMIRWYPYISAGAGALLIGILVIVIVVRRKKRIA